MALMDYREPNQVRWVGVRPGHNGTQVVKHAEANNATVIVYTVPASSTLYLVHWWHNFYAGAVAGDSKLFVRDGGDVLAYWLSHLTAAAGVSAQLSHNPFVPCEIPAGYDVCVVNAAAGHWTRAGIFGWVE